MHLIICYTPLQVLIAEKIIEQHPNETFFGVMICSAKNSKFDYYSRQLATKCYDTLVMEQHIDRWNLFKELAYLKWKFCNKSFEKVFVASINDLQIQTILSTIKFNQLFTFDDGTANIVPNSCFYIDEPNTKVRKWVNRLFGNKFNVKKLKAISQGHYTIYPQFNNIIEKRIPLVLNPQINGNSTEKETINLLLGQPVYIEKERNISLAGKVIEKFNIQYYLPHPREQYQLNQVEYINTPLIFEDYISQQSDKYRYRIYTYFSSAVLNVMNLPNIEIVVLRINTENPAFEAAYQLFDSLGLNIIDLRD